MPFSPSTRILRVAILAGIAAILLWPSREVHAWGASALFVLPLLIWLLTSRAVRDAPPFDDRAFHRTLPPGAGYAFWRVVRFHLFGCAGVVVIVAAYCWLNNLSWAEVIWGVAFFMIPATALVSVFSVVSSLATSRQHWGGWPYIYILLIPAATSLLFSFRFWELDGMGALVSTILASSVLFPFIWWLVAARGQRKIGAILGVMVVFMSPWFLVLLQPLGSIILKSRKSQNQPANGITIRRICSDQTDEPDSVGTHHLFSHLTAMGLGEDEFVWINRICSKPREGLNAGRGFDLYDEGFATDANGRAIGDVEPFSRVFSREVPATRSLLEDSGGDAEFRSILNRSRNPTHRSFEIYQETMNLAGLDEQPWLLSGSVFQWRKLGDFPAIDGGRCWFPADGGIQVMPLEESGDQILLTVYVDRSAVAPAVPMIPLESGLVVVAVDPGGQATVLELSATNYSGRFLMSSVQLDCTGGYSGSQGDLIDVDQLRRSRLHVFWPEFKGTIETVLPVPD